MPEFIDNYDDMTVPEVTSILDTLGADQLEELHDYEQQNKNRKTLIDEIKLQISGHTDSDDESPNSDDGTGVEEPATGGSENVEDVRVRIPKRGQYAGQWFDNATTTTLKLTPRVEQELQRGNISRVNDE